MENASLTAASSSVALARTLCAFSSATSFAADAVEIASSESFLYLETFPAKLIIEVIS